MHQADVLPTAGESWELWNLRALFPGAGVADLRDLADRRRRIVGLERKTFGRGLEANRGIVAGAGRFLGAHPELRSGLIATLHLGPYALVPALYALAGLDPVVVVDRAALERLRDQAEAHLAALGASGRLQWLCVDEPVFAGRLLRALRGGGVAVVYLDGNGGSGGPAATRERGMRYELPGRAIRLQTGLGRLLPRAGCAVHGLLTRWSDDGNLDWEPGPAWRWPRDASADEITTALYDWAFTAIRRHPEQWAFWGMLGTSSECFRSDRLEAGPGGRSRRGRCAFFCDCLRTCPDAVRATLAGEVEVWPGDVLVDLANQHFYAAEGLRDDDLEDLRWGGSPSLADLRRRRGGRWVEFHLLRLYVLDLVALEIGGPGTAGG